MSDEFFPLPCKISFGVSEAAGSNPNSQICEFQRVFLLPMKFLQVDPTELLLGRELHGGDRVIELNAPKTLTARFLGNMVARL